MYLYYNNLNCIYLKSDNYEDDILSNYQPYVRTPSLQDDRRYARQPAMSGKRSAPSRRQMRLDESEYYNDPEDLTHRRIPKSRPLSREPSQYAPKFEDNYYDQDYSYSGQQPSLRRSSNGLAKTLKDETIKRGASVLDHASDVVTKSSDTIGNVGMLLASKRNNMHKIANHGIGKVLLGDGKTNGLLNVMDKGSQIHKTHKIILSNTLNNVTDLATNASEIAGTAVNTPIAMSSDALNVVKTAVRIPSRLSRRFTDELTNLPLLNNDNEYEDQLAQRKRRAKYGRPTEEEYLSDRTYPLQERYPLEEKYESAAPLPSQSSRRKPQPITPANQQQKPKKVAPLLPAKQGQAQYPSPVQKPAQGILEELGEEHEEEYEEDHDELDKDTTPSSPSPISPAPATSVAPVAPIAPVVPVAPAAPAASEAQAPNKKRSKKV